VEWILRFLFFTAGIRSCLAIISRFCTVDCASVHVYRLIAGGRFRRFMLPYDCLVSLRSSRCQKISCVAEGHTFFSQHWLLHYEICWELLLWDLRCDAFQPPPIFLTPSKKRFSTGTPHLDAMIGVDFEIFHNLNSIEWFEVSMCPKACI